MYISTSSRVCSHSYSSVCTSLSFAFHTFSLHFKLGSQGRLGFFLRHQLRESRLGGETGPVETEPDEGLGHNGDWAGGNSAFPAPD